MIEIQLPLNVERVYEVVGAVGNNPESYPVEDAMMVSPDSNLIKVAAEPPFPNQFAIKAGPLAVAGGTADIAGVMDVQVGPGNSLVTFTVRVTFTPPVPQVPDTARLKLISEKVL